MKDAKNKVNLTQLSYVGCKKECPNNGTEVCGTNMLTYPNKCVLENDACDNKTIQVHHEGPCGKEPLNQLNLTCPNLSKPNLT